MKMAVGYSKIDPRRPVYQPSGAAGEGFAACRLGSPRSANPYRDFANRTDCSGTIALSSEWERGYSEALLVT